MKVVSVKEWEDLKNQIRELEILAYSQKHTEKPQFTQPALKIEIVEPLDLDSQFTSKELIKELTKELISSAYT